MSITLLSIKLWMRLLVINYFYSEVLLIVGLSLSK